MIPIGAIAGGLIVSVCGQFVVRELALRVPWLAAAVGELLMVAAPDDGEHRRRSCPDDDGVGRRPRVVFLSAHERNYGNGSAAG